MARGELVCVTGGASFIGSHLVDALVALGYRVRVVDNLTSGHRQNIGEHITSGLVEFQNADLMDPSVAKKAVRGCRKVFHLAAVHGGRGYIELYESETARNLVIDGNVFLASVEARVEQIVYASSGCVYPLSHQTGDQTIMKLKEDMVGPPYEADHLYGWAKLMGELVLRSYHERYGIGAVSCRIFTAYGPRAVENHAVMGMIARAFVRQNPFEVWGDGQQLRNWTYVGDVVDGLILASERINDGRGINIGSEESISVKEAADLILEEMEHCSEVVYNLAMPVGPRVRIASAELAGLLLGWRAKVTFRDGVKRTIEWYRKSRNIDEVKAKLGWILVKRQGDLNYPT